jgi:hypothetical protein
VKVRAFNGHGESDDSPVLAVRTPPVGPVPSAPTGLKAVRTGPNDVTIEWIDTADNETGFQVYISADQTTFRAYASDPPNFKAHFVRGLQSGTAYWFKVRAFNANGESADSPILPVRTTAADTTPPPAPGNLQATDVGARSVQLKWDDGSNGTTTFRVAKSRDGGWTWTHVGSTELGITTLRVGNLAPGKIYRFKVRAARVTEFSEYSNEIEVQTSRE